MNKTIINKIQKPVDTINNHPKKLDHPKVEEVPKIICFSVSNNFALKAK
jgi:hypothetical protein